MRPLISLLLVGCVLGSEKYPRPRDLEDAWLVDRTRLLGVKAEPPEIFPGETAAFEALFPQPDQEEPWPRVWLACPADDSSGAGCNLELGGTGTVPTGVEDGFIGFEPGLPPVYTAPIDLLDGLETEAEKREGVQILAQVAALPPEILEDPEADIDFNAIEMGFKRLIVSLATTPNHNPVIADFVVDRNPIPPGAVIHVSRRQQYDLGVVIELSAIEQYDYLTSDGVVETRVEEPYVDWYTTGGTMLEPITLYPYTEATWEAPAKAERGTWYAVVRDRRGGLTWITREWAAE